MSPRCHSYPVASGQVLDHYGHCAGLLQGFILKAYSSQYKGRRLRAWCGLYERVGLVMVQSL